jgi:phage terminase Nu1 subunit (DNA packaging protein)
MTRVKSSKKHTHPETHEAARLGAGGEISTEERYRMIAEAAYYRAVKRGFAGGDTVNDWLEAQAEVDAELASTQRQAEQRGK